MTHNHVLRTVELLGAKTGDWIGYPQLSINLTHKGMRQHWQGSMQQMERKKKERINKQRGPDFRPPPSTEFVIEQFGIRNNRRPRRDHDPIPLRGRKMRRTRGNKPHL